MSPAPTPAGASGDGIASGTDDPVVAGDNSQRQGNGSVSARRRSTGRALLPRANFTRKEAKETTKKAQARTNTDLSQSFSQRLMRTSRAESPSSTGRRDSSDFSAENGAEATRDKKKSSSLLVGLLGIRGGRKKAGGDDYDDDDSLSVISQYRPDGLNVNLFTSPSGGATGYTPRHKEPPKYVRVRLHHKKQAEFDRVFLAQELSSAQPAASTAASASGGRNLHPENAIWTAEFSNDGKYLATAGQDQVLRVYALLSTREERLAYELGEEEAAAPGAKLSAPVFHDKPIREYRGHTSPIHDLSWSKNNFLLSASADRTVRLWHPSIDGFIKKFTHDDNVVSIAFHPTDDRFFLAGCLDSVLRLWSIPDAEVAFASQEADIITAVAFAPDGTMCLAGLMNGDCLFYDTMGLRRQAQIQVRSSRGKNSKGTKVTSIRTMAIPPDDPTAPVKVLVSSNDSRIRIYDLETKSLDMKLKGHENVGSNVKARFSDDGKYVICASEDKRAFLWSLWGSNPDFKDKRPCESFVAHSGAVTAALLAPRQARQLLNASGDPVYELCNPPPVVLMSMAEAEVAVSQSGLSDDANANPNVNVHANANANANANGETQAAQARVKESPAYTARSGHVAGNIIVTADRTGQIRVFRQDCGHAKRRNVAQWETASHRRIGLSGRPSSILTRASASSRGHSRRDSLVGAVPPSATTNATLQQSSDMIMSWRQEIEAGRLSVLSTPARSERSVSPVKRGAAVFGAPPGSSSTSTTDVAVAGEAQKQPSTPTGLAMALRMTHSAGPRTGTQNGRRSPDRRPTREAGSQVRPPALKLSREELVDEVESEWNAKEGGEQVSGGGVTPSGFSLWSIARWRPGSPLRLSTAATSSSPAGVSPKTVSTGGGGPQADGHGAGTRRLSKRSPLVGLDGAIPNEAVEVRDGPTSAAAGCASDRDEKDDVCTSDGNSDLRCAECGSGKFRARMMSGGRQFVCSRCGKMAE